MHIRRKILLSVSLLGLLAAAGAAVGIRSVVQRDADEPVSLAQCPAAVQATIAARVGAGTIREIERAPSGNFEVDVSGPDGHFEFVVAGDGTYLGPEGDDDGPDDDDDDDGPDDDD